MNKVRTRFSPSPTGFQHIGGMRTAFYCWLWARHSGGTFILRIEDTDRERQVPGAVKFLFNELKWLGIDIDEAPSQSELELYGEPCEFAPKEAGPFGPYIQSQRKDKYAEAAEYLIEKGFAYRCDCTPEMLEKERNEQMARKELPGYSGYCRDRKVSKDSKHVIRFRMPHNETVVLEDACKGRVSWESLSLRDTVLVKSDGLALYHLANVIDDHDMQISHVIRGDEWLPSAPIHLLLYKAFGWEPLIFSHIAVVNGTDGKKLSKRRNAPSTDVLREQGFLPEAVLNYVTMIGWSEGDGVDRELYSVDELIKCFDIKGMHKSSGVFDPAKLQWMNGVYIRALNVDEFIKRTIPFLNSAGISLEDPTHEKSFRIIAPHVQERVRQLNEVVPMVEFLFSDVIERDLSQMHQKGLDSSKCKEILDRSSQVLEAVDNFSHSELEAVLRPLADEFGIKPGPLFGVLRIAVTGKKITPPLFESFEALGKCRTLARIQEASNLLKD